MMRPPIKPRVRQVLSAESQQHEVRMCSQIDEGQGVDCCDMVNTYMFICYRAIVTNLLVQSKCHPQIALLVRFHQLTNSPTFLDKTALCHLQLSMPKLRPYCPQIKNH